MNVLAFVTLLAAFTKVWKRRPHITNEQYTMLQEFVEFIGENYQGDAEDIQSWKDMINSWNPRQK